MKILRALRGGTAGLIALCSIGFLTSTAEVHANSVVDLEGCVLLPNTGNYVRYPGQIDCFTGLHVSVEGNAGNNIGTPPSHTDPRGTRDDRRYDAACRAVKKNVRASISSALKAKQALRNRDWNAAKEHTKSALKHAKIAKRKTVLKHRLKSKQQKSN